MGFKYILDPNVITGGTASGEIKRRREVSGASLVESRRGLLADQRNNAISALQAGLLNPDNLADVLHDTLELLRSSKIS